MARLSARTLLPVALLGLAALAVTPASAATDGPPVTVQKKQVCEIYGPGCGWTVLPSTVCHDGEHYAFEATFHDATGWYYDNAHCGS
jgi:hypothetical protein